MLTAMLPTVVTGLALEDCSPVPIPTRMSVLELGDSTPPNRPGRNSASGPASGAGGIVAAGEGVGVAGTGDGLGVAVGACVGTGVADGTGVAEGAAVGTGLGVGVATALVAVKRAYTYVVAGLKVTGNAAAGNVHVAFAPPIVTGPRMVVQPFAAADES